MFSIQSSIATLQPATADPAGLAPTLPLSTAQSGMWFMQKLISPDSTFNIAEAIEIHGAIDPTLFETALRQVAMEAETVRIRLCENHEGPQQLIVNVFNGDIPFFDVADAADPQAFARTWMLEELNRPVDLLTGTLWQCALFKLADDHYIWYHRSHHIIMDGYSGGLIARRVASLYTALVEKRPASGEEAFGSLRALIEDERAYRASPRFQRDRDYWMRRFADKPKPVSLANRYAPHIGKLLRQTAYLPADSIGGLRQFAQSIGISFPQYMIGCVAAYLHRVTGKEDLVMGMPVTARTNARMRQVPGMTANALPLRLAVTAEMSVSDLLAQVGKEVRQLLRHQSYRYEDLRRDLHLMVAHDQHLFSMVVNIEPFDYDLRFAGHPATPHNLSNASAENLAIFVYDRGDGKGLTIDFDANSALYGKDELIAHQERFIKFIAAMAEDTRQTIGDIDLLTVAERQRLHDWNATGQDFPQHLCIHQLFERQVLANPQATAVVFEGRALTYAELNAKANQLAHHLRALGIKPEARVAICLERGFEMVIGLLAVLKAGGAYVPLDPSYPKDRLAFMLRDCAPQALLTMGDLAAGFISAAPEVPVIDLAESAHWAEPPAHNLDPADVGLTSRHLAYMIYTSGSTGMPKGAMNEHRAVVNRLLWQQSAYRLRAEDAVLQKTPFSFDVSVWEFYWPLMTGARLVMARPEGHKDPAYLADIIRNENITALHFVPSMLQVFLDHPQASSCANLKQVMCSGEALPEALARRFQQRLPDVRLHNLYGPTEAAVDVTSWTYSSDFAGGTIPIGKPIANTRIYVLDPRGRPTPIEVIGEIFIGGIQVGRGYWDRPELTDERFVPDPFGAPGDRLYRTGDLGRWLADGTLEYHGRNDFQVKLRGFRIELGEIEAQLASHPEVREAVVVTRENGAGDPRLVAFYTANEALPTQLLRHYLGERLPDYMVPAAFVRLEQLPLSPNGKLDRKALPADAGRSQERVAIAPRTHEERQIARIWQSIFALDELSVDDNFFDLGGHSLQAVQMVAQIEAELGRQLPLVALFKAQTIEQLARLLEEEPAEDVWAPLVQLRAGGTGSPLFCVPGLGAQAHHFYHLAAALGNEHPVYAFQPQGLDGHSKAHVSIDEMADYYLGLLLAAQPTGPYFLVGHSLGGCVAFEMAKRLEAAQRTVGFVALVDASLPSGTASSDAELNVQALRTLAYFYGRNIEIDAATLEGLSENEQLALIKGYLVELDVVRANAGMSLVRGVMNISREQMRMRYRPGAAPVRQVLFLLAEERFSARESAKVEQALAYWKRLSKRPFVQASVPGNHISMLIQAENARKMADILRNRMVLEKSGINNAIAATGAS